MIDAQRVEHSLGIRYRLLRNDIADTGWKKLDCSGHTDIIGHAPAAV
jgi:hypothetical protein